MTTTVQQLQYGPYTIRARQQDGTARAIACRGEVKVIDVKAGTVEEALLLARDELIQREKWFQQQRVNGVPTAEEYIEALQGLHGQIGKHHWLMLKAHYRAPDRKLTARQLARAAGYAEHAVANEKYGRLARLIAEFLNYQPRVRGDGTPVWTSTIAEDAGEEDGPEWVWSLRPEVAEALRHLNVC
jgi:hypothetical protein